MSSQRPLHPGRILKERFLDPLGITLDQLAQATGLSTHEVRRLVEGQGDITADVAIRLGLFFDVPPRWWLEMQAWFDTEGSPLLEELRQVVKPYPGLAQVLVTPRGIRPLQRTSPQNNERETRPVPRELLERLRTQTRTSEPRTQREIEEVVYENGATALVGRSP